jgi:hypothetical protein
MDYDLGYFVDGTCRLEPIETLWSPKVMLPESPEKTFQRQMRGFMTLERIVGVCFWIVITSAAATGQQAGGTTDQAPQPPATSVIERTYPSGDLTPWRRVQTRSASDSRDIVIETVETLGVDGKLEPIQEIKTETIRTGPNTATRHDVFGLDGQRQRTLLERTQSEQEISADGNTSTVQNGWVSDLNGRLGLTSRQIEKTRSIAPDIRQSDTTLLRPGMNETLRESERTEYTERQISPTVVRRDTTQLVRDVNGLWQSTETRSRELRELGSSERLEEEMIRRRDMNGKLTVSERSITRRSEANGREDVVIETYAQNAEGFLRSDTRLGLSHRVRTSTTATADGGRYTVEEVEARSQVAPSDPMRVIRRTVVTVRKIDPDRWATERQVFELNVNGRLVPVVTETEETAGK